MAWRRILVRAAGAISRAAQLLVLALAMLVPAVDAGAQTNPPREVIDAIQDAGPPASPEQVLVGGFINDIQEIDFKNNNYVIDLYVWFRWPNAKFDPAKSMEFMNRYASDDNLREQLYEAPKTMPDGGLYSIIRYQGRFSKKFNLEDYPFDTQKLAVVMEDTVSAAADLVYVPSPEGVTLNPKITLPGFTVGEPTIKVENHIYPTDFGDISEPQETDYSRMTISLPIKRPVLAMSIKAFVPIFLIVVCAALVFFVRPTYVEGRIGLGITALLTLVALQLSAGAALPDVDYLMTIDKVYLLAYLFIILSLMRIVATSWRGHDEGHERSITRFDRISVAVLILAYFLANLVVTMQR